MFKNTVMGVMMKNAPPWADHGHGRVLCFFLYAYHDRDGARVSRRSHHGPDTPGKLKNTSIHCSSRRRGEGKRSAVAVTATVTGVTKVAWPDHGLD